MRHWFWILVLGVLVFSTGCPADDANNEPPIVVLNVGSDVQIVVGETLSIEVSATDPEGGPLSFDYVAKPEGNWTLSSARFFRSNTGARFDWAPLASDVTGNEPLRLIFIVTDDSGKVTEKTVNVSIVPGNGVPRFLTNSSVLYDPRVGKPVKVEIQVRDDDSNEVELTMDESTAPFGASFDQTGAFSGVFEWQPDAEQQKKRVHSINFNANDLQTNVPFKLTVVIRSPTAVVFKPDQTELQCPGEEVISHEPIGPQTGLGDYNFSASLTAAARSRYDELYLYWTVGDPYKEGSTDPRDSFEGIKLEEDEEQPGVYKTRIANQASIIPEGGSLTISYTICAIDVDSSDATSVVCVPSSGDFNLYHSFTAYHPSDEVGCLDDGQDLVGTGNETFETASAISTNQFGFFRTCAGNEDYHSLTVRPGETYLVAAVYNQNSNLSIQAFDNDKNPIQLNVSTCTGLSGFEAAVPASGSAKNFYFKISGGDSENYQIRAVQTQTGTGACADDAIEPNDTVADAAPLTDGQAIMGEICSPGDLDIYQIALTAGQSVTLTNRFLNAQGNLDMTLFPPSQSGEVGISGTGVAFTFSFNDEEVITHQATETGNYYLLVFNNNQSTVRYNLTMELGAGPTCTDDDAYSTPANHTQASARLIANSEEVEFTAKVCPGQPDWYRRTEFKGAPLAAELTLVGGDGTLNDITVEVYDIGSNLVTRGVVEANGIYFDYSPNPTSSTGDFFYKVSSTSYVEYSFYILRE